MPDKESCSRRGGVGELGTVDNSFVPYIIYCQYFLCPIYYILSILSLSHILYTVNTFFVPYIIRDKEGIDSPTLPHPTPLYGSCLKLNISFFFDYASTTSSPYKTTIRTHKPNSPYTTPPPPHFPAPHHPHPHPPPTHQKSGKDKNNIFARTQGYLWKSTQSIPIVIKRRSRKHIGDPTVI